MVGAGLFLRQLSEVTRRSREKVARASVARNRPLTDGGPLGAWRSRPMERPPGLRPGAGGPWEMRERLGTGGFGNVCLYQHRVRRRAGGAAPGPPERPWNTGCQSGWEGWSLRSQAAPAEGGAMGECGDTVLGGRVPAVPAVPGHVNEMELLPLCGVTRRMCECRVSLL